MNRLISTALTAIAFMLVCITASAQSTPFDKYADKKDVTYVYISKAMLSLVGTKMMPSINGVNVSELSGKLNSIQIINSGTKAAKESLKTDVMSIVKKGKYETLMQISENDSKVNIYHKEGKDSSIIVMMTDNKDDTVVVVFSGTFSTENIMNMLQH